MYRLLIMSGCNIVLSTGVILLSVGHCTCILFMSDGTVAEGCCRSGTGWLEMQSVPGFPTFREECTTSGLRLRTPQDTSSNWYLRAAVSSLVEAGTVNDLRELSKWVHCVHRFLCLGCALSWLVRDIQSRVWGLNHCANPGEELCQRRGTPVSTLQPLPVVS